MNRWITDRIFSLVGLAALGGCAWLEPKPPTPSSGHIQAPVAAAAGEAGMPRLAGREPLLPEPEAVAEVEKYTLVVKEVDVREVLFALTRDAGMNVDIDPAITGVVTINAIEQTLPQILERIARQVSLRYEFQEDNLLLLPDTPFFRSYPIDYIDMRRSTSSSVESASQIESAVGSGTDAIGGGDGKSGSSTSIKINSEATNRFWNSLVDNVITLIDEGDEGGDNGGANRGAAPGSDNGAGGDTALPATRNVIAYPETGLLTVRATGRQHTLVRTLIERALQSANRQVMIQATIIEVRLSDDYQAGIDWEYLAASGKAGFNLVSMQIADRLINSSSLFRIEYDDPNTGRDRIKFTVRLLQEFGDVRVLSSPQIMALNNQTALLQVVDNVVFFEVEQETNTTQGVAVNALKTKVRTVPVGITMSITPRINGNGSIILNVRPSISRITRFVNDPNPVLTVSNPVPQIRVRQMESMLRLDDNQIGVLGGLMQDDSSRNSNAVPGLSKLPGLGAAFKDKQISYAKTELVVFLRPVIVKDPGLDGDLKSYRRFLEPASSQ